MPFELGSFSIGSVAGVIVGVLAAHFLTKSRNNEDRKIKEFNLAATKFRSRILAELEGLYPIPTKWPPDKMMIDRILRDKFPKLQIAVAEFKEFLPHSQQTAFDKAWFVYRMGEDGREIDKQDYHQYIPHSGDSRINDVMVHHDNSATYQNDFKRNVANLLYYAKLT